MNRFPRTLHRVCILLLYLLILAGSSSTYATSPIILQQETDILVGGNFIELYEDTENQTTFRDILQGKGNFYTVSGNFSATQHASSTYWLRFNIQSTTNHHQKWILEILDARQDVLTLYEPNANGQYDSTVAGIAKGFSNREYLHKNFAFNLYPANTGKYYYLKVKSSAITSLLFKIRTIKEFAEYGFNEYYLLGIYYGILAMMIISSIFIFITTRERLYLYYPAYVLLWILRSLMKDGTGFQYIWPDYHYISLIGYYLSKPLLMGTFVIFSFDFISFTQHKELKKAVVYSFAFYIIWYTASLLIGFSFLENILFHVPVSIILYVAIQNYRTGYKPARYFILGSALLLLSLLIEQLRDIGFLDPIMKNDIISILMVYSTNISMVLLIIIMSFALADRIKFLKKEQEHTQQLFIEQLYKNQEVTARLNSELEIKVKERTQLLEEANIKLKQQSDEINKMNALLDMDNWKLKQNLIEQKESRIAMKDTSYDDFLQVYPDDAAACKYLETLKWEKGYSCLRCGNSKYGAGKNVFSRRCTKCRHEETVTAHTIFNKCKFSINKALYIVTIINRNGEDVSITNLSNVLDLRYATCWAFAQKTMENRNKPKYQTLSNDHKLAFLILDA